MIKDRFLAVLCLFLVICLIAIFPINAAAESAKSWYCVRAKDHKQPVADADMRFIEDYNGYYVDKVHGDDCEDKVIYLTFDAGYENGNVKKILDILNAEEVKGAFFILGNLIARNGDLVKQMADDGHVVANHTNKHRDMTTFESLEAFRAELEELERQYKALTGMDMPKYFRPPEGKFSKTSMQYANELGYKTIFWSFAYADWDNSNQMSPASALEKILANVHNGAVILLHPTSETNAAIMQDLIRTLKSQGYRFGTLDELCGQNSSSEQ